VKETRMADHKKEESKSQTLISSAVDPNSIKINRLKGMKIRDEFLCPITYELMREPVVAMDGHTYEKSAIEKWLKSSQTSPRSGEPMEPITIPNMNLKKLIQDIINEVKSTCDLPISFVFTLYLVGRSRFLYH
jgi:hypothetical protein